MVSALLARLLQIVIVTDSSRVLRVVATRAASEIPTDSVGMPCYVEHQCEVFEDKAFTPIKSVTLWHGGLVGRAFEFMQVRFIGEDEDGPRLARGEIGQASMKTAAQMTSTLKLSHEHGEKIVSVCGTVISGGTTLLSLNITTNVPGKSLAVSDFGAEGNHFCFADGPIGGFHGQTSMLPVDGGTCGSSQAQIDVRLVTGLGVIYEHKRHISHVPIASSYRVFWKRFQILPGYLERFSRFLSYRVFGNGFCGSKDCPRGIMDISRDEIKPTQNDFGALVTDESDRMFGRIKENTIIFDDDTTEDGQFAIRDIFLHTTKSKVLCGFQVAISRRGVTFLSDIRGCQAQHPANKEKLGFNSTSNEFISEVCGRFSGGDSMIWMEDLLDSFTWGISFLDIKTNSGRSLSAGDPGAGSPFCFNGRGRPIIGFHGGHSEHRLHALGVVIASGVVGAGREEKQSSPAAFTCDEVPVPQNTTASSSSTGSVHTLTGTKFDATDSLLCWKELAAVRATLAKQDPSKTRDDSFEGIITDLGRTFHDYISMFGVVSLIMSFFWMKHTDNRKNDAGTKTGDACAANTAPVRPGTLGEYVQKLEDDLDQHRGRELCLVCIAQKKEYLAAPCGHLIWCADCKDDAAAANQLQICAVCRTAMAGVQRLYY